MYNALSSDHLVLPVDEHGDLHQRVECFVLGLHILFLQRIHFVIVEGDIGVPAHGKKCASVGAEHVSVDLELL